MSQTNCISPFLPINFGCNYVFPLAMKLSLARSPDIRLNRENGRSNGPHRRAV